MHPAVLLRLAAGSQPVRLVELLPIVAALGGDGKFIIADVRCGKEEYQIVVPVAFRREK